MKIGIYDKNQEESIMLSKYPYEKICKKKYEPIISTNIESIKIEQRAMHNAKK